MLYGITLCLCVSLSGVLCYYLNKEEGAECEWEGRIGKCVKETRCLTTLDEDSPKHPICSRKGGESIICCTDCELVDNTKNTVFSPTSGLYWKNGQKARDSCLQYLEELPYRCKQDGYYGGISRQLDEENNCYTHYEWAVEGERDKDRKPSAKYPYRVLVGFGDVAETAMWVGGGFIISDTYIVTAAYIFQQNYREGVTAKFVAMGVNNLSDSTSTWQIRKIKRIITHDEYKDPNFYHNIALIETRTPIKFDENVLPACLHVEQDAFVKDAAVVATCFKPQNYLPELDDTILSKRVKEHSEQECKAYYGPLKLLEHGYNHTTLMCYGKKSNKPNSPCKVMPGEALMVTTQFSSCMHTAVAVSIYMRCDCVGLNVYTRISHYVPWIESLVWP